MTIRYGLIGAGMMGQEHIRNIRLLGGCAVTAIAEPDNEMSEKAVDYSGGRATAYKDYKEMLSAQEFDAIIVTAPNDLHYPIMLDLLDTNYPILCEKPLCDTTEHCREVIAKADKRDAPVWVAMEYRYMAPIQRLIYELRGGTVGKPYMMAIREHRFPFLQKVGSWNRFNDRTGGTMVEKCCHFWDLMRFILKSDPVRVFASAGVDVNHLDESYDGRRPDMIDNGFVVVDFQSGQRAMLDLCMFGEGSYWREIISITGDKGRVDAKVPGPARFSPDGKERAAEIEISNRSNKQVTREDIWVDETILAAGDHFGSTFFQHQRFRDLVHSGKGTAEVTLKDGLWSVIIGEAAEKSTRTGKAIMIENEV